MNRFSILPRLCYSHKGMVKLRTFTALLVLGLALVAATALNGTARAQDGGESTATPESAATPDDPVTGEPADPPIQAGPTPQPADGIHEASSLPAVVQLFNQEPVMEGYGPDEFPRFVNPLTGLVVSDPSLLERRPMAIKVTNYPRYVRPQSGLEQADLVFEYYLELGISRFIAVYYGQDADRVGPVRSGRLFDEHIFRMYDSLFVFGNADERVMNYFLSLEPEVVQSLVVESNYDHDFKCGKSEPHRLCRDAELKTYNNLFANTAELTGYVDQYYSNYRPDLTGMYFSDRVPMSTTPGMDIRVRYSPTIYHLWLYDNLSRQYYRYQETDGTSDLLEEEYAPHFDKTTGRQLSADNLAVLFVDHNYYVKTDRSEIYQIDLNGQGSAFVFRDGFAYQARWVRPDDGGVLQLYTMDGEPFPLKPGQTWYQVINPEAEVSHNGQYWRFVFVPPEKPAEGIIIKPNGDSPLDWFYLQQNPSGTWYYE